MCSNSGNWEKVFLKPHGSMCIASVIGSPFFAVVQRIMQKIFSCEITEPLKLMWPLLAEEKSRECLIARMLVVGICAAVCLVSFLALYT